MRPRLLRQCACVVRSRYSGSACLQLAAETRHHPARSVSNGCAQEAHSKPVSFKFDTTNSESAREDAPDHLNRLDTKPVIVGLLRTNASIASALKPRQMPRGIPQCTRKLHSLHRTLQCKESFARYPVEWQCNRRGTGHRERRGHRKRMRAAQRC